MKKILFLTDMWSPKPTANSICVQNIASVLQKRGWKVYINAFEGKEGQTKESVDGIEIEYTRPSFPRFLLTKAVYTSNDMYKSFLNKAGVICNRLTRLIFLPAYPVAAPLFAKKWSERIRKQVLENDIDIVVSVNAPFDSLAAGYLVKQKMPSIKWIAYYIDSGTNYGKDQSLLKLKKILQQKATRWENKILSLADKIIIMEGHKHYYEDILNASNKSRMTVLNVPLFNVQKISSKMSSFGQNKKEIWTYMGSIRSGFYNPQKLFSWFREYCKFHNAELHLYGATNMEKWLLENCDRATIFYHGLIAHNEVDEVLKRSDVLLYFRSEKLDSISGKFFEYLMYQKPVVYFGFPNDINWKQVTKYPLGIAIDESSNKQDIDLEMLKKQTQAISKDLLWKLYYNSTPDAFADAIDEM